MLVESVDGVGGAAREALHKALGWAAGGGRGAADCLRGPEQLDGARREVRRERVYSTSRRLTIFVSQIQILN